MLNKLRLLLKKNYKLAVVILLCILMPGIYMLVYYTGGIKFVYSHSMYIPILIAGIILGSPHGLIIAFVGGIILGPMMPVVIETGEPQLLINWLFRMLIFLMVGGISGYFSDCFKRKVLLNKKLMSSNIETNIPNCNYLLNYPADFKAYTVMTVLVCDRENITDIFGEAIFNQIMNKSYKRLQKEFLDDAIIIQSDANKLWIAYPQYHLKLESINVHDILEKSVVIDDINIYVEFFIGSSSNKTLKECKTLHPFRETDRLARHALKHSLPHAMIDNRRIDKKLRVELLGEFRHALLSNETFLAYQPVLDLKSLEIIGFEALIRWNHPKYGLIYPNEFIPLVESTLLINDLFDWVLRKSLNKINEFKENKIDTSVSVNLSAKNFRDSKLSKKVIGMITEANIDTNQLKVEITETVLMNNPEESQAIINQFRDAGIKMAIDDFGTGYSSFSYLAKFNVDYLKIDYSFISRIDEPDIYVIVKAMINLAHQLNFKSIAEGIETEEELRILKELGCDYAQGYYFARPMHEDDVVNYYKEQLGIK